MKFLSASKAFFYLFESSYYGKKLDITKQTIIITI